MRLSGEFAAPLPWLESASSLAERAAAFVAILLLVPLFVILGLAVWLASGLSPFVGHRRIGHWGRPFWMLKFRSMWKGHTASSKSRLVERLAVPFVPSDKSKPDPRVSHPLGRFLRRTSLDELPQLLHVARGEMSFIGPRPITEDELALHYAGATERVLRHKPGITGLWQVMGRSRLTYRQRRRLDLFWTTHQNPRLRLWIAVRTLRVVLVGENAH